MGAESGIESYLCDQVRQMGGEAIKIGHSGWPDRIVLLPGAVVGIPELKAPREVPRALQVERLETLRALGFKVAAPDSREAVRRFLRGLTC